MSIPRPKEKTEQLRDFWLRFYDRLELQAMASGGEY